MVLGLVYACCWSYYASAKSTSAQYSLSRCMKTGYRKDCSQRRLHSQSHASGLITRSLVKASQLLVLVEIRIISTSEETSLLCLISISCMQARTHQPIATADWQLQAGGILRTLQSQWTNALTIQCANAAHALADEVFLDFSG